MDFARRRNGGRRFEAKVADQNGDTRERPPMLCSALPYHTVFTSGDKRAMPPRMGKRPNHKFCVYFWHGEKCSKEEKCIFNYVRKSDYEENPSKYAYLKEAPHEKEAKQASTRKQEAKAAKAAEAKAAGEVVSSGMAAKLQSMLTMFEALQKTQQDTQAKLVAFEACEAAVDNEEKKAKAAERTRYEANVAALAKKQSDRGDEGLFGYESISEEEAP